MTLVGSRNMRNTSCACASVGSNLYTSMAINSSAIYLCSCGARIRLPKKSPLQARLALKYICDGGPTILTKSQSIIFTSRTCRIYEAQTKRF